MEEGLLCLLYLVGGVTIGYYIRQIIPLFKRNRQSLGRWD